MCRKKGWVLGMTQKQVVTNEMRNKTPRWGMWVKFLTKKGLKTNFPKNGNFVSRKIFGLRFENINFEILPNSLEFSNV